MSLVTSTFDDDQQACNLLSLIVYIISSFLKAFFKISRGTLRSVSFALILREHFALCMFAESIEVDEVAKVSA